MLLWNMESGASIPGTMNSDSGMGGYLVKKQIEESAGNVKSHLQRKRVELKA